MARAKHEKLMFSGKEEDFMTFIEQFIHYGGQREDCACLGHGGGIIKRMMDRAKMPPIFWTFAL